MRLTLAFPIIVLLLTSCALAQAPNQTLSVSGVLRDSGGAPATGPVNMTFRIYEQATGGIPVWSETQTGIAISAGGRYAVNLGAVSALGAIFFDTHNRWLTLEVDGDGEMTPRLPLSSVPFAYNSELLDGLPPSEFALGMELMDSDSMTTPVGWQDLSGVPAGFADDVDDVDDADSDPMNEVETCGSLGGIPAGFADGVYEVTTVLDGTLIDNEAHLARLRRSLAELDMAEPCSGDEIAAIQRALVQKNGLTEGMIYLQVTRGAADRDFAFPKNARPTLVMFTQAANVIDNPAATTGISVITTPDIRWARRDIKTVGLLAASMAKMAAIDAGANDAWMVDGNGHVTEGSSNNAYIVTTDGAIVTRALSNDILHGITRKAVLALARETGMKVAERTFTVDDAKGAAA